MRWLGGPKLDKWFYINVCTCLGLWLYSCFLPPPTPHPPPSSETPWLLWCPDHGCHSAQSHLPQPRHPHWKCGQWPQCCLSQYGMCLTECLVVFLVSFFHFNGFTHNGGGGGSERAGFLLFYAFLFFMSSFNWPLAVFVKDWKSREIKSNTQKGKCM